jgi:hypothetical protein
VLAKVLNVFRMCQILFPRVFVVVFLVVVYLILVLVVAMVSWTVTKIRQLQTFRCTNRELCEADCAAAIQIIDIEDLLRDSVLLGLWYVGRGLVFEAVGFNYVVRCPQAVRVVVVEVKE